MSTHSSLSLSICRCLAAEKLWGKIDGNFESCDGYFVALPIDVGFKHLFSVPRFLSYQTGRWINWREIWYCRVCEGIGKWGVRVILWIMGCVGFRNYCLFSCEPNGPFDLRKVIGV